MPQKIKVLKKGLPAIEQAQSGAGCGSIPASGSESRFWHGTRALVTVAEYLDKAGWKRDLNNALWWDDPHPELHGVSSNSQNIYRALEMQIHRDLHPQNPKLSDS